MANPSKKKGTAFEVMVRDFMRERLHDPRIDRRALNGSNDMGDLYNIVAHGAQGIVECKNYSGTTPRHLLEEWQAQTEAERYNADADFALLVVHRQGIGAKRLGETPAYVTLQSLLTMCGITWELNEFYRRSAETWVRIDLETACSLIEGSFGEQA